MMVECFSSVLSGAAIGSKIGSMYKDLDRKQDVGHFFCLLDIDAFMDIAEFKQRIDQTIDAAQSDAQTSRRGRNPCARRTLAPNDAEKSPRRNYAEPSRARGAQAALQRVERGVRPGSCLRLGRQRKCNHGGAETRRKTRGENLWDQNLISPRLPLRLRASAVAIF